MKSRSLLKIVFTQLIAMAAILQGCGVIKTDSASTSCASGTAQIMVFENSMQRVCGCNESSGVTFTTGLTCTVSAGTRILFVYSLTNSSQNHQISITGYTTFTMRHADGSSPTDGYQLSSTGSYSFSDTQIGDGGTLVVQ